MAVSEFLLLRDKILRRVTNSPALLYCTGRCHTFALQGSELLLPFVKAFAPETQGGWGGVGEVGCTKGGLGPGYSPEDQCPGRPDLSRHVYRLICLKCQSWLWQLLLLFRQ